MAEKDFHIREKYNFRHALKGLITAKKRKEGWLKKIFILERNIILDILKRYMELERVIRVVWHAFALNDRFALPRRPR